MGSWRGILEIVLGWMAGIAAPPDVPGCLDMYDTPLSTLTMYDTPLASLTMLDTVCD